MNRLARKQVQALTPYLSARRIGGTGDVWLNANESPYKNEYSLSLDNLNRYSECQPKEMVEAYAQYAGLKSNQVLTTRGADEGIELLIRAYCEPGEDAVLFCPPTYGMYGISAETIGVERVTVPLTDDWQLDMKNIEANLDSVKLIFVCSPNNPTGNLVNREDIVRLLDVTKDKAIVVMDEAYIDFCPEASTVDLLAKYENLAILRTMSKAFALAGLRCGYTLANDSVIQVLLKVIAPYPVPIPVAEIATQALSAEGIKRTKTQVQQLNENRLWLEGELARFGQATVFKGWGNYVLTQFENGEELFDSAWNQGVIWRRSPVKNGIRISVGSIEECQRSIALIQEFYAEQKLNVVS